MWTFIISLFLFCLAMAAMAIGIMFGRRGIAGSCSGIANITGPKNGCDVCNAPCDKQTDQH